LKREAEAHAAELNLLDQQEGKRGRTDASGQSERLRRRGADKAEQ
jgi:hypothetical protein